jgi:hypothetical protein
MTIKKMLTKGAVLVAAVLLLMFVVTSVTSCEEWLTYSEENPEPYVPPLPPISLQLRDCFVVIGSPQQFKIDNSENQPLIWYSSNPGVATVSDTGVVQGISEGKAVISVITSDGKSTDSCTVSVFDLSYYVIENYSSYQGSEYTEMTNLIWYTLVEKEYEGDWMANYIKTNKIKIILSDDEYGFAWIYADRLDRIYIDAPVLNHYLGFFSEKYDNFGFMRPASGFRWNYNSWLTHEVMHLVQYSNDFFRLTIGMRPDICATAMLMTEYLAFFYTEGRSSNGLNFNPYITIDMPNAVEIQSKYMMVTFLTDEEYEEEQAKDPFLPNNYLFSSNWPIGALGLYMVPSIESYTVRGVSFTRPLRQASKEDILQVARFLLACRDPKMAGVTDEAIWYVFDFLRKELNGVGKYSPSRDDEWEKKELWFAAIDGFQDLNALWDAEYAAQQY